MTVLEGPSRSCISYILTCQLIDKINTIKRENKDIIIIIAGYLNIDLLKYSSHNETTNFLDHMFLNNVIPKITLPIRITEKSAALIDQIFTHIDSSNCIPRIIMTQCAYQEIFLTYPSHIGL